MGSSAECVVSTAILFRGKLDSVHIGQAISKPVLITLTTWQTR